ncbi:uncharacterized protein METZ01_LOCUS486168, partial [marine metagenome]
MTNIRSLKPRQVEIFDYFAKSAVSERFPGGILAIPSVNQPINYYAIAANARDWRILRPLLLAWAGPTISSFDGNIFQPESDNDFENYLISRNWYLISKIIPGSGD